MSPGYQTIIVALIRSRELAPLGFKGITHIPIIEITNVGEEEFEECIRRLVDDDVLGSLIQGRNGPFYKREKLEAGVVMTVNCRMTANQIREQYRGHLPSAIPQYTPGMRNLDFKDRRIKMPPRAGKLLSILFSGDLLRQWGFAEIWEEGQFGDGEYERLEQGEENKKKMNQIFNAATSVNDAVQKMTLVDDFLDFDTHMLRIHPRHIP